MSYASWTDVQALDVARKIGQGNNPTATQVQLYCELTAGEIDSVLRSKGYGLPISPSATSDLLLLRKINAEGAFALMEEASPAKPDEDKVRKRYEASLDLLREADDILETPKDRERSRPRGPGVTEPPPSINEEQTAAFFTRDMEF